MMTSRPTNSVSESATQTQIKDCLRLRLDRIDIEVEWNALVVGTDSLFRKDLPADDLCRVIQSKPGVT